MQLQPSPPVVALEAAGVCRRIVSRLCVHACVRRVSSPIITHAGATCVVRGKSRSGCVYWVQGQTLHRQSHKSTKGSGATVRREQQIRLVPQLCAPVSLPHPAYTARVCFHLFPLLT